MTPFFRRDDDNAADSLSLPLMSLLTPHPEPEANRPQSSDWETDLGLSDLLDALALERRYRRPSRQMLLGMPTDPDVIRWRQGVLADFLANPALVDALEGMLPHMAALSEESAMLGKQKRSLLLETSDRLGELDLYAELLDALHEALAAVTLTSPALTQLRDELGRVIALPDYQRLRDELPRLREPLRSIGSLTIGINLDDDLKPTSAVLMSINAREMGEPPSLLDQLLGLNEKENAARGIAPAHQFPRDRMERKYHDLFKDIDKLMQQTAKPIAQALRVYVKTNSGPLYTLEQEIAFFIAAVRLVQRSPVDFCRPEVLPMDERVLEADGLHNIALLLRQDTPPVPSDVRFDDTGRVAVLTGPNSGGKTTFLRNVGLAQVMAQAGLFIPATRARFSPADRVQTHFPRLETREQGRLAEEAARLRELFQHSTSHSLILLNETFSSTAFGEALYLAQDVLAAMCVIGARAVFATHLVELVDHFAEIEERVSTESGLFSLVAGIELREDGSAVPTYQITRREPLGRSYAQEIARRHGISLEQILHNRGADPKPENPSASHESTVS